MLPRIATLPDGLHITVFVDGRPAGVFSDLGDDRIGWSLCHLAGQATAVIAAQPVREYNLDWPVMEIDGFGLARVAPPLAVDALDQRSGRWLPEHSFMIQRDGGIGDLVMLLPVLGALQAAGHRVCLVTDERYMELFEAQPCIDWVYGISHQPWPEAERCVDLRWKVDQPTSHPWFSTHHRQDLWLDVIRRETGVIYRMESRRPVLSLPDWAHWGAGQLVPAGRFALLHLASVSGNRCYPWMAEVARQLSLYMPVVAAHHERWRDCPAGVIDLGGRMDAATFAGVVARATVVIGPDSAAIHLAGAQGVPFVGIFGPIAPATRVSCYPAAGYVVLRARPECPPCGERTHCGIYPRPCLSEVPPDQVVAAALQLARRAPACR